MKSKYFILIGIFILIITTGVLYINNLTSREKPDLSPIIANQGVTAKSTQTPPSSLPQQQDTQMTPSNNIAVSIPSSASENTGGLEASGAENLKSNSPLTQPVQTYPIGASGRNSGNTDQEASSLQLPMPDIGLEQTQELGEAYSNTLQNAAQYTDLDKKIEIYQDFIRRYPVSKITASVMHLMGEVYCDMGKYKESMKVLQNAKAILGDDRYVNLIDVSIGTVEMRSGNTAKAEAVFREVMNRPIVADIYDWCGVIGQLFTAPISLAQLYKTQKQYDEADTLLRNCANKALELTNQYPQVEYLPSYFLGACNERIRNALEADSAAKDDKIKRATAVVEEIKPILPRFSSTTRDYGTTMAMVLQVEYTNQVNTSSNHKEKQKK